MISRVAAYCLVAVFRVPTLLSLEALGWQVGSFASKTTLAAVAGLALPSLALAAGLGKLSVLSTLGQPRCAVVRSLVPDKASSGCDCFGDSTRIIMEQAGERDAS